MYQVADMHCDTIKKLQTLSEQGKECCLRKNDLHIDLEKMRAGGYILQNFAAFVPLDKFPDAAARGFQLIGRFKKEMEENRDLISQVFSYSDIEENLRRGRMSALLTVEEGQVCGGDLRILRRLYDEGVRMMSLTWNFENCLAWPSTADTPSDCGSSRRGLKPKGFEIVAAMEELGMIVDVSHLSDDGFWDVCRVCRRPFVASHSDCRALAGHPRDLTDEMIRALADKGGVAGINYYSCFLRSGCGESLISDIVRHMSHMRDVGGIGVVGLGSDFDGINCRLELGDCSGLPLLADEMQRQGFSPAEIDAVFSGNVMRVYRELL